MAATLVPLTLAQALGPAESARPVVGATRYWVTDHGRVFSLVKGLRLLRPCPNAKGYLCVALWRGQDCDSALAACWPLYVHELVALTFIGPRPMVSGVAFEIDHIDGDKTNNCLSNLRYVTRSRNLQLAIAAGRYSTTKLSSVAVWTLRCRALVDGYDTVVRQATREYGATVRTVRNALAGRTWATVPDPASRPTSDELAQALFLDSEEEAHRLLGLSPFSPGSIDSDGTAAARVLPFRSCEFGNAA